VFPDETQYRDRGVSINGGDLERIPLQRVGETDGIVTAALPARRAATGRPRSWRSCGGRVALVGDAAWGSGPTGMGTTLSLVGAHVLAGELARTVSEAGDDPREAFARYEGLLRRYADSAQGLPPGGARLLHPSTRAGLAAMRAVHRIASSGPARGIAATTLLTSARHVPDLPDYPFWRT